MDGEIISDVFDCQITSFKDNPFKNDDSFPFKSKIA